VKHFADVRCSRALFFWQEKGEAEFRNELCTGEVL
jgi:hypothetical protein